MDLRAALISRRARILARLAGLQRDHAGVVRAVAADPPDDEHDPEGATTAFERQLLAALIATARAELADVDEAVKRMAAGRAGRCEACGVAIGAERLRALPTARLCIRCAAGRS